MAYGITNKRGPVPLDEVRTILLAAASTGIELLDTAAAYGNSEAVLGKLKDECSTFRIVTKLPKLSAVECLDDRLVCWQSSLERSLSELCRDRIDVLLAHDSSDLLSRDGDRLWRLLESFRASGQVGKIGASIYEGAEIVGLLDRYEIEAVQVPLNAFDNRLARKGYLALLADRNIEIHARSVFLQGLLLISEDQIPEQVFGLRSTLARWQNMLRERQLTSLEGALLSVRQCLEVDVLMLGVTASAELREVLKAWRSIKDVAPLDLDSVAVVDKKLIDPRFWPV